MKTLKTEIDAYENAVCSITYLFLDKYFEDREVYWIGGEVGGVLSVNDYFFNFTDMLDFLKNDYSNKQLFEYYDYALGEYMKEKDPINIRNYLKLKKTKYKKPLTKRK